MTLPTKIGISALTVGTITGAGYAGSTYLMKKETVNTEQQSTAISTLIDKEYTHILLKTVAGDSNTDQEHWKTIWNTYESQSGTNANPLQLEEWSTRGSNNLIDKLKAKCELLKNEKVADINDSTYQNATKYCAREVTIADEAGKNSLKEVDISGAKDDQTIWQSRIQNKNQLSSELVTLSIDKSSLDANKLKEGCRTAKAKKKQEPNYSNIYKAYKKICTKQEGEQ